MHYAHAPLRELKLFPSTALIQDNKGHNSLAAAAEDLNRNRQVVVVLEDLLQSRNMILINPLQMLEAFNSGVFFQPKNQGHQFQIWLLFKHHLVDLIKEILLKLT